MDDCEGVGSAHGACIRFFLASVLTGTLEATPGTEAIFVSTTSQSADVDDDAPVVEERTCVFSRLQVRGAISTGRCPCGFPDACSDAARLLSSPVSQERLW